MKLDLKEWIAKILNAFTTKAVYATKVGNYWTGGTIVAFKRCGIVTVKINAADITALSARTTIASIPASFAPPTEISGNVDGSTRPFFVETNGEIKIDGGSAIRIWADTTYVGGGTT